MAILAWISTAVCMRGTEEGGVLVLIIVTALCSFTCVIGSLIAVGPFLRSRGEFASLLHLLLLTCDFITGITIRLNLKFVVLFILMSDYELLIR